MPKPSLLALLLAVLSSVPLSSAPAAAPAAPYLVKDLNRTMPENVSSVPIPFGIAGGRAVFSTRNGQLWASDGTTGGTFLLKDLAPLRARKAKDGGFIARALRETAGGRLFFLAQPKGLPRGFWATDGTSKGTQKVSGASVFDPRDYPGAYFWSDPLQTFFFTGYDKLHGVEPWVSDGTPQGTHLLSDLKAGTASSGAMGFASAGSSVVFSADAGPNTGYLWRSDGTAAGTLPVPGTETLYGRDFLSMGRQAAFFNYESDRIEVWATDGTALGTLRIASITGFSAEREGYFLGATAGRLYFYIYERNAGYQFWTSDGTSTGTRVLTHFPATNVQFSYPQALRFLPNGTALFFANDGTHGLEWWRSDGTEAGTRMLKDSCPGNCVSRNDFLDQPPVLVGNKLFAHLGEPWMSDGTEAGTRQIADTCPGPCQYSSYSRFAVGGLEIYSAKREVEEPNTFDLWRTDGTSSGTFRLIQSQHAAGFLLLPGIALGDRLLFDSDDGADAVELWATDGTVTGTHFVADLDGTAQKGSAPSQITPLGKNVFFVADDGVRGSSLWKSNGTVKGTSRVYTPATPPVDPSVSPFSHLIAWNGRLLFTLNGAAGERPRLWASDGSAQGTRPISDAILPSSWRGYLPLGNRLLFPGAPGSDGLWATDGTAGGTVRVTSRVSLATGSDSLPKLRPFAVLGGKLLFAGGGAEGAGLWKTDGTDAGTVLVKALGIEEADWAVLGGKIYFQAAGPEGRGLYTSDGSAAGTRFLGLPVSGPFTLAGSRLFIAESLGQASAAALWVSDGTAAGTRKLAEVGLATDYTLPVDFFTVLGNKVFFVAKDTEHGDELWRSDGTAAGTFLVDINPGAEGSVPAGLAVSGGVLYFNAYDGEHGTELWRSDGTRAGTVRVAEIAPGARSANPQGLTLAGRRLFFSADDGSHGPEPWALCLASPCSSSVP